MKIVVKSMPGFCEPFCYFGTNTKGKVISFTNLRLVMELLALLSGYTQEEVATYFKRNLTGQKTGHTDNVIASDSRDFAFCF